MSLLLEMIQAARRAPGLLGAESSPLVRSFLLAQQNADGGFKDRAGRSDLYYTVFGLEGLAALEVDQGERFALPPSPPEMTVRALRYLQSFGSGDHLDLVHLCCLARAWAVLAMMEGLSKSRSGNVFPVPPAESILRRVEAYRSGDGGYSGTQTDAEFGTAYGAFLALGAYEDLERPLPSAERLLGALARLKTLEGAFANCRVAGVSGMGPALALATAAGLAIRRRLLQPSDGRGEAWLLQCAHSQGGFRAGPQAPMPDLLSTATVLHALAESKTSFETLREPCLDYVDSLWTNEGGFFGHWGDEHLDCEYTFYGLLALGRLA